MIDMKAAILEGLSLLPVGTAVSFAREEMHLPIIVISDEDYRSHDRADGQDYLVEYICQVDVYAATAAERETLSAAADAALCSMGMKRLSSQDLYDEKAYAYRKHMRYRALLQGDWIYQ